MAWYSAYGTGVTLHGFEAGDDGRVRFTSWVSVFGVPLVPLRSWSGVYAGQVVHPHGGTQRFADLRREFHDLPLLMRTFGLGLAALVVAVAPGAAFLAWTPKGAAKELVMLLVLASACWPLVVIWWHERRRDRVLHAATVRWIVNQARQPPAAPPARELVSVAPPDDPGRRELGARGVGLLLLACGLVLGWIGVIEPLRDAAHHADSVEVGPAAPAIAAWTLGFGLLFAAFGESGRMRLQRERKLTALGWCVALALMAAGAGVYFWLRAHLSALGYQS